MASQSEELQTASDLFSKLPTAAISDALDRLKLTGSLHGIGPLREGQNGCGPAYTVSYEPIDDRGGTVGDFLDEVPAGSIIVIENEGRTDCTVWGGIMTRIASDRGVAGTVINGVCRDTAEAAITGYPIRSAGKFMRTGKDRVRLVAVGKPVVISGVKVSPGDIVCGDADGLVSVPAESAAQVAELAAKINSIEDRIVEAARSGATLVEARAAHGYHSLQTAEASNWGKVNSPMGAQA